MSIIAFLELANAVVGIVILILLIYLLWFQATKGDVFRSMLFLKDNELRSALVIFILGVLLFIIHEIDKATEFLGATPSELVVEILETVTIIVYLFAVLRIFNIYYSRKGI